MTPKPNEDLFQDTTMTFGEHLEELRVALFKALLGLIVGCLIGLFVGDWMVEMILGPLEGALETYYAGSSIKKYDEWASQRVEKNLPVPYTHEQIVQLVNEKRMLFEIMYVDPRQAWQEATRVNPQWIGKLPAATEPDHAGTPATAETLATTTVPPAEEKQDGTAPRSLADWPPFYCFIPAPRMIAFMPRVSAFPRCSRSG